MGAEFSFHRWLIDRVAPAAFDEIDLDQSGKLDVNELYAGVLLVYVKLSAWFWVLPPTRAYTEELLHDLDENHDGQLDRHEFRAFCLFLSKGLIARIFVQLAVTFLVGPLLARLQIGFFESTALVQYIGACFLVFNVVVLVPLVLILIDRAYSYWAHKQVLNNNSGREQYYLRDRCGSCAMHYLATVMCCATEIALKCCRKRETRRWEAV
jgi:hypothetical protein